MSFFSKALGTRRSSLLAKSALCVVGCWLALSAAAFGARTDVVVLRNGDHITGEVKKLQFGRLQYKTDDIGTINIEWLDVAELTSNSTFEVEISDSTRYVGRLEARGNGTMAVVGDAGTQVLAHAEVVGIYKLDRGFWKRLDGSFDLGLTYTQADNTSQFNFDLELEVRRPNRQTSFDFSGILTDDEDSDNTRRFDATFSHLRLRRSRWFSQIFAAAQGNQELGLDLRVLAGGAVGREAIQTNRTVLRGSAGLAVKEEWPVEGASEEEIEALVAGTYSFFTFDYPSTSIDIHLSVFHGLESGAALRLEGDISIRRELVKDLYFSVSAYESYDADPIVETAEQNDWGFTTSIGWSF
jgi:hypothetical protein